MSTRSSPAASTLSSNPSLNTNPNPNHRSSPAASTLSSNPSLNPNPYPNHRSSPAASTLSSRSGTCARWCVPPLGTPPLPPSPPAPCRRRLPPPAAACHPLPPPLSLLRAPHATRPGRPPALHAAVCAERACRPADAGDDALHATVLRRHAHHHRLAEWHCRGPRRPIASEFGARPRYFRKHLTLCAVSLL